MIKIKEVGSLILCSTSSGDTINKNRVDLGTILRSSGGPRGIPGGPMDGPRGTENAPNFFGASLERPGVPLGWFWRSEVILGSVLGGQNVAISLVVDGFLRCHVFHVSTYIFRGDAVFLKSEKPYSFDIDYWR